MEVTNPSSFGTTVFGEPETIELPSPHDVRRRITVTRAQGEWRAPERLTKYLPKGFTIPLECYTGADGVRRIAARCSVEELIELGVVGGLAVIHGTRGFDPEVDHSYRAMHLIHQHVRGRAYLGTRGMKEHLTRQFNYSRDLYVRRLSRPADGAHDVLPDDVGRTSELKGPRLSVTRLAELGRRAAQKAGCRNPASNVAISLGFFEAAKLNPLEIESEAVPALVRSALFDVDDSSRGASEEITQFVTERLLEAIQGHLDDSQAEFERWFVGPKNSLVKQIAQQKSKPGGQLEREEVRQALVHLGWSAYEYVGQCVHALMRTIKNSIPDPLNEEEKQLFEHMHESQPYYGGLPAALLAERMEFLRYVVLSIWDDPGNQDYVRVLHRLLHDYAEMVVRRRKADRQSKQRPHVSGQKAAQGAGGTVQLIDNLHSPASPDDTRFEEIAEHIRELKGIECDAACTYWDYRLRDGDSKELVAIQIRCECGEVACEIRMPIEEYTQQAKKVLDWD